MNNISSLPRNHNMISSMIITRRLHIHKIPTDWGRVLAALSAVGEVFVVDFRNVLILAL